MKIGIIGAGGIAQAVAKQALRAGYEVILSNSRGPETLKAVVQRLGAGAAAGSVLEAAQAALVVLAVQWSNVAKALGGLPDWNGRILIDATNPTDGPPDFSRLFDWRDAVVIVRPSTIVRWHRLGWRIFWVRRETGKV